jgi:aryl-alcohol dehydrogenase-like predicted oxidoreductase
MMHKRMLGHGGPQVGAIGLGCMGMSWAYAESSRDDDESIATLHQAIDLGVSLVDTADVYGDGHNESLVGRALAGRRDQVTLATKCGLVVDDLETKNMHRDGSPDHVRAAVRASLSRLGTDVIDLYYLHRVDDQVPLADSWGAMSELVAAGLVRRIGLSEVTVHQAAEAQAIHPVAAIQSELSLWSRDPMGSGEDDDLLAWCRRNGAAFVPFSPLGRGFLTGAVDASTTFEQSDFRSQLPRFTPAARAANQKIVDLVREVASAHDATPAQVALAWVLAQGEQVIPIPGTRRQEHLRANLEAAALVLTADELAQLDQSPVAVGTRY